VVNPPGPLGLDQLNQMQSFIDFKYSMTDAGKKAAEDAIRAWLTKCYSPGPKTGDCAQFASGPDWEGYDTDTISLTGPIDLSGLKYNFNDVLRYVMVTGDIKGVPITVRRTDGQTVAITASVWFTQQVDLGQDPPVVGAK
jgi:hypothetical protein